MINRRLLSLVLPAVLCVSFLSTRAEAQPVNDTCTSAEVIPAAGPFPYLSATTDISLATVTGDPGAPSC